MQSAGDATESSMKETHRSAQVVAALDACVRCGGCKAQCPTYAEAATEGMGARGRVLLLRKLADGELQPSAVLEDRLFSCLLCGACNAACPLGVDVTGALYEGRRLLGPLSRKLRLLGLGARLGFKRPLTGVKLLRLFQDLGEVVPFHRLQPFRMLKELGVSAPETSLREEVSLYKAARPKARIAVFAGCTVNYLYPHIGRALIRSLNALHYDVVLPKGEVCCGAPLRALGLEEDAAELAERNLEVFKKLKVEAVVGPCPTCVHSIKDEYRSRWGEGIDTAMEAARFFGDKAALLKPLAGLQGPVVYHEPCHSRYGLKAGAEPKRLLKALGVPLADAEGGCCGFGGTFRVLYQDLSKNLLEQRREAYRHGAAIITSCPNCVLQLRSGIKDKEVKHIIEVINEAVQGEQ